MAQEAFKLNQTKGFIPFATSSPRFNYNRIPSFPRRPFRENPNNVTGLNMAKNFLYFSDSSSYDNQNEFVTALSGTNFDAVIIDVFHRGRRPFTKRHIHSMKFKNLGAKRLVLAYINIGHAESFRYYFKSGWQEGNPPFLGAPVADDPDKYYVQYWHPEWQKLMMGTIKSYAYGIVTQGFDGVVIDGVDAYVFFEDGS